jgi:carbohydrate-selective porin OprB
VGLSIRPTDSPFYISGGAANAYGSTTKTSFDTLDQWTFFSYGEVGWTPTFHSLEGRYTVSGWNIDERTKTGQPGDWGVTAVADQQLCSMVEVFARYGYSEAATLRIHHYAQAGLGWRGLIGSTNDMTGLGFSWQSPRGNNLRDEKVVEGFYRAQVTRFMQLSVGAQAIVDPGQSTKDVVGAFWGRVRIIF